MQKLILIADDDNDDIDLLTEAILEDENDYKCVGFSNAHDLLNFLAISIKKSSAIFIDINMPGINGKECLKRIKSDLRFSSIPVVICSTSKNPSEIEQCMSLGANYYFIKPFVWKDWKNEISKLLKEILYADISKAV